MPDVITQDRRGDLLREVLVELKRQGGRAKPGALFAAVTPRLSLTPYELEPVKSGSVRWEVHVRFYSVDCVRAGFIQKAGGYWTLTDEGEKAIKLPGRDLIRVAIERYRAWKGSQGATAHDTAELQPAAERQATYDTAVEHARTEIEEHLDSLGPYEFQKLVAELLLAMGYHVPHIAPPGKDGGVDVVAYRDPLGTQSPRVKVPVKHRDEKLNVQEVRALEGLLRKEGDIGLLVSSGGFTSDVVREVRSSSRHIELMDQDRLIRLWQEHYDRITEAGRALLPLVKVFFLKPEEE